MSNLEMENIKDKSDTEEPPPRSHSEFRKFSTRIRYAKNVLERVFPGENNWICDFTHRFLNNPRLFFEKRQFEKGADLLRYNCFSGVYLSIAIREAERYSAKNHFANIGRSVPDFVRSFVNPFLEEYYIKKYR